MPSVLDLWRAVDPRARLLAGDDAALRRPTLGIERTRAAPPHLPALPEGYLLLTDSTLLRSTSLDALLAGIVAADLEPAAILLAETAGSALEKVDFALPVLASADAAAALRARAELYLRDEAAALSAARLELRLAFAEAALAEPDPAAPAGLAATRLHRGAAVVIGGTLRALHARAAGRALAVQFSAVQRRLLSPARSGSRRPIERRLDGLWVLEGQIGDDASAWLFDDVPMAAMDHAALDALTITLRALLRRPGVPVSRPQRRATPLASHEPLSGSAALDATLLAVARFNGRVAPAARALGVHRNTVLYRLKRGFSQTGLDPRRPEDALAIMQRGRAGDARDDF